MAYVDSKLAEMRSKVASPSLDESIPIADTETSSVMPEVAAAVPTAQKPKGESTYQAAQARTDRVYERPNKRPGRGKKHVRGEADVARDAYIDQFMQEAQVPIYDRSAASSGAGAGDNDSATAEAFKAQLLQDMELNRRRPPKAASAQAANVMSGPKLGGSRQQREKMRAIQEAEAKK